VLEYSNLYATGANPHLEVLKRCFDLLKPNGTLIFKWNEVSIPLKDILSLTPEKAVCGHPSGKRMGTHWVLFLKSENNE
jgi:23S rRNA G2069 N7-methylase RlmK/C1962 C5-methylase RlmI